MNDEITPKGMGIMNESEFHDDDRGRFRRIGEFGKAYALETVEGRLTRCSSALLKSREEARMRNDRKNRDDEARRRVSYNRGRGRPLTNWGLLDDVATSTD